MWDEIVRLLPQFENAVLTALDAEGYPYSVRVSPEAAGRVVRVPLPAYAPLQAGPASLLCHAHDENLWNLRSFLVRGTLSRQDRGWVLEPGRFVPGAGVEGPLGVVRFVIGARRNAERYLEKRGLARPSIPWKRINEIKAQASRRQLDAPADPRPFDPLPWVSALYLATVTLGAAVAIREGMPGEFTGGRSGRKAFSPGLPMLAAQSILTLLSTRGGKVGMAGTAGLTALGAGATVGMLREPTAYRAFSSGSFDPPKAVLVSALVALPALMTTLGARRLLAR